MRGGPRVGAGIVPTPARSHPEARTRVGAGQVMSGFVASESDLRGARTPGHER